MSLASPPAPLTPTSVLMVFQQSLTRHMSFLLLRLLTMPCLSYHQASLRPYLRKSLESREALIKGARMTLESPPVPLTPTSVLMVSQQSLSRPTSFLLPRLPAMPSPSCLLVVCPLLFLGRSLVLQALVKEAKMNPELSLLAQHTPSLELMVFKVSLTQRIPFLKPAALPLVQASASLLSFHKPLVFRQALRRFMTVMP